jgi:hypothetical protein
MSSSFMNAQTFQAKNDSEDVMKMMESNNTFSKEIRKNVIKKNASANLMNKYDQISQEQAMEILNGGMTEDETRRIVNDPRMKLWMMKNDIDISPANLDRFIQNRMVPNVRKITQSDPTTTSNITMKKYVGDDIQWRPKDASEKSNYATPEETRLPQHVTQSGKGMQIKQTSEIQNEYYRHLASKNLNNFQPIEKVQVGRATRVGGHYGHVDQNELARYDPGQQRVQSEYRDNTIDVNATKPTLKDLAMPRGEIVKQENFEARKHLEVDDFLQYSNAQRNLRDILQEFHTSDYTHVQAEPLMYDSSVFQTQQPLLIQGESRDLVDTHDLNLRTVIQELPNNFGVQYKQTVDTVNPGERTKNERKGLPDDSLMNRNIVKNYSLTAALQQFNDPQKITNLPRQDLSEDAWVPRQTHGGRLPKHENDFNNTRPDDSLLYENNGGHGVRFQMNDINTTRRQFDVTRESRNFTQESKYTTPGKSFKQNTDAMSAVNTNQKSYTRPVYENTFNGSTQNSNGRPVTNEQTVQSSRRLFDEPNSETIKIDIVTKEGRNKQKSFVPTTQNRTDAIGEFDQTKNKRTVVERTGAGNMKQQYNIQLI